MSEHDLLRKYVEGWRHCPSDPMWFRDDAVAKALAKVEARVEDLESALGSLADDAEGYFQNWIEGAPQECMWASLTVARRLVPKPKE